MGESFKIIDDGKQEEEEEEEEDHSWVGVMMEEEENDELLPSSSSSIGGSSSSTSSFDTTDDASSSVSSSSAADHSTPSSYDLSELMAQLPIKRGLSKFYQGKSESYTSLSRVTSIEDLVKKESPYRRKMMKACKSYGGGLDTYRTHTLPKPIISKKSSTRRVSSFPSFLISTRPSFAKPPPPPLFPVQENL